MPWHCCAVGCSHAQGGREPVGAAIRLWLGGRICRVDGALPRTQPGCSPHPCLQCQHLRAVQNARHVFSFSPDNDSASAGLRADAFVSRHGPVPSATDRPGSGPCTWPRDRAAPGPGHPGCICSHTGCQLATVHDGHSTITCTWLGNLSWPHSPSQPSTCCGPRAGPVAVSATWSLLVPWAPALSTALPSEQQHQCLRQLDQQESCCCWSLCRPEPHSGVGSLGPHLQVSCSIPVLLELSPAMCSLQAHSGFGPGLAAQFCCFFSSWRLSTSITSLCCEYLWQCCGKRLARERILWPWGWLSCHKTCP